MNVHDSERLSGLLEEAGYTRRAEGGRRRRRRLQHLRRPGERRQPALRQPRPPAAGEGRPPGHADRRRRLPGAEGPRRDRPPRARGSTSSSAPTTSGSLPALLERARHNAEAQVEIVESLEVFPSTLPARRESAYSGWVSISVGLQQHLHVLHRPGAARHGEGPPSRRDPGRGPGAGRPGRARGDPARPERQLLRRRVRRPRRLRRPAARRRRGSTAWSGSGSPARTRATSPTTSSPPWPRRRRSATSCTCRCSRGSDDVLRRMRRGYRQERYLGIIDRVRAAMPDAAITTDIIVGFPGETEADFEQTLDVVRQARFASAFTFQYSKRPGTPAADDGRPAAQGGRPGALPAADRAAGRDQLGGEPRAGRPAGRAARRRGRGPQGRRAPAGSPAAPATAGWSTSRPPTASGPATSSRPS